MLKKTKEFANGKVHLLTTHDGYPIETTDTFLPFYTKDSIGRGNNYLDTNDFGSRKERYFIGVSVGSGCPVGCKFCATGNMRRFRNLTAEEIVDQVLFVVGQNKEAFIDAKEHKINYTRMSDPFLNIEEVKKAIFILNSMFPKTHHYISTIGVKGSDFSWIKDNITLQISLHSLKQEKRDWLIPFKNKMSYEELGAIRTKSNLKTTINLTLVDEEDFDVEAMKKYFDPKYFFIKLSPINKNEISEKNHLGDGIIESKNIV